jgi:16S rRNA (guanine(966)-N(2))-methyltransferase RsmD
MPRVTTGSVKNRKLQVPDVPNIRVAQDVLKLALFSIIGERVVDAECLDLFAGSGSLGIEALSRGAKFCIFVDENKKATETIERNIKVCKFGGVSEVKKTNAIKYAANTTGTYDLIFVDPFYDDLKQKFLFQNLEEIINEDGIIAFSHGKNLDIEEQILNTNLKIITQRRFGRAYLTILKK